MPVMKTPKKLLETRLRKVGAGRGVLVILGSVVVSLCLGNRGNILAAVNGNGTKDHPASRTDWPVYGGQSADDRYSALHQIDRANVHKLKVAWTFDTKEAGGLQTNPLIVGRVMFGFTPSQKVIALDAATGKHIWTFDSGTPGLQPTRGLSYWTDGTQSILFAGLLSNLYAIDPANGKLISSFGDGGKIDLRKDLTECDISQAFAALT